MATLSPTQQPTPQQPSEFTTRHSFSYRDGANNKYHLKDSLEIDNSLANLLEKKLYELYKLKEGIKSFPPKFKVEDFENLFNFLDKDKSGKISKTEFWNFYTTVVKLNIEISNLYKNSYTDDSSTGLNLSIKKNFETFIFNQSKSMSIHVTLWCLHATLTHISCRIRVALGSHYGMDLRRHNVPPMYPSCTPMYPHVPCTSADISPPRFLAWAPPVQCAAQMKLTLTDPLELPGSPRRLNQITFRALPLFQGTIMPHFGTIMPP